MTTEVLLRAPVSAVSLRRAHDAVERAAARGEAVRLVVSGTDVTVVDAVARLRLLAVRRGAVLDVVGADPEVFDACGLRDVLMTGREDNTSGGNMCTAP